MATFKNAQDALEFIEESKNGIIDVIRQNYAAMTDSILSKTDMEELEYRLSLVRENLDDIFRDEVLKYTEQQRNDDLAENLGYIKEHSTYHPTAGRA